MHYKNTQTIRLTVNRQEQAIRVSDIIYAQVTDKLCSIYLTNHPPYHLFLTIASLKAMLPANGFLQISRNCLVSLNHLQNVESEHVYLLDGTMLPYSHRQKHTILAAFQQHLSRQAQRQDKSRWKLNIFEEFRCFDRCPFPLAIVEVTKDPYIHQSEYFFRYVNEALAAMLHAPIHELINVPFYSVIPKADPGWRDIFTQCAFEGAPVDRRIISAVNGRRLRVVSYQPHYGFCSSLILEDEPQA